MIIQTIQQQQLERLTCINIDRGLSTKKVSYDAKKEAAKSVSKTKPSENPTDKKTWTWDEIRKLKPSEYDKFEKEIDMANREGRIR
jgi:hypothetical protein